LRFFSNNAFCFCIPFSAISISFEAFGLDAGEELVWDKVFELAKLVYDVPRLDGANVISDSVVFLVLC